MIDSRPMPDPNPAKPATLEGWDAPVATPQERALAIEHAFDYRGDVTIGTTDGRTLEGYVFDRDREAGRFRVVADSGERTALRYDEVARLTFTGKDAAHGKSFETWVRKYAEKMRGKHV